MIDHNRDGFIDKEDLHDMLASLGKDPTDEYLEVCICTSSLVFMFYTIIRNHFLVLSGLTYQ